MNTKTDTPETDEAWRIAETLTHENGSPAYNWAARDMRMKCRELERERNKLKDQLFRICGEGFGHDDTIGLEPADEYVLRKLAGLRQQIPLKPTNSHFQAWELTRRIGLNPARWSLILPNGDSLDGLTTEAAAISARAHLRPMWPALVQPPTDLYEPFHTDGKVWGFFDREGNLHAQFPSRTDAAGCAARREDADYATPANA